MFLINVSDDCITETVKELSVFTPMETAFRDYYLLSHGQLSPAEGQRREIEEAYHRYTDQIFLRDAGLPYDTLPSDSRMFPDGFPIQIMKHTRYIPAKNHTHEFIELFYVLQGTCTHMCGSTRYRLQAGDFCFWQFDAPHYIHSDSDETLALNILIQKPAFLTTFLGVLAEENLLSSYFNQILYGKGDSPMILFRTGDDREMKLLICSMYQEFKQKNPCWKPIINSYLGLLFSYLLRQHSDHLITSAKANTSDASLEILRYIQLHYLDMTLEDLCREFNYTPSYLSRLIKKKTGMTFKEIVNREKIRQGSYLLVHTSRSIQQIAGDVHCCDASHFGRLFQKIYGVSPSEYREKQRNSAAANVLS